VLVLYRFWNDPDGGDFTEVTRRRARGATLSASPSPLSLASIPYVSGTRSARCLSQASIAVLSVTSRNGPCADINYCRLSHKLAWQAVCCSCRNASCFGIHIDIILPHQQSTLSAETQITTSQTHTASSVVLLSPLRAYGDMNIIMQSMARLRFEDLK
jgi:hypothetical protein